jgi:hypothetical protein
MAHAVELQNSHNDAGGISMVDLIAAMTSDAEQQESNLDNVGRVLDACVDHNVATFAENDWERRHSRCATFHRFESHVRCPLKPSAYLERIYQYTSTSPCNAVIGFIYLQRISSRHGICLTSFNIQRYLLTAIMLASKTFDDVHASNKQWALIGDIEKAKDMLLLELDMLVALDFSMTVHREEYDACVSALEDLCDDDFAEDRDSRNGVPIVLAEDDEYHEMPPALFHAAVVNRLAKSEGFDKLNDMGESDAKTSSPRSSDAFSRSSSSWEKESLQSSSPSPENVARDKVHVQGVDHNRPLMASLPDQLVLATYGIPAGPACENEPECNRYLDMSSHAYILYV